MSGAKLLRLSDYRRPEFTTDHVDLAFDIHDAYTSVISRVRYERSNEGANATQIALDAHNPNPKGKPYIKKVTVNGKALRKGQGFRIDEANNKLLIDADPLATSFDVEIETYLEPHENTALTGLYKSDSCYVTQCESQGFRRITPFLDRPDVMATYSVRIEADEATCPVIMANGNCTSEGTLPGGRHFATYNDPWPKPSYLFAIANGQLEFIEDHFLTKSGRDVKVRVYTERGQSAKAEHALSAVLQSMKWDEDVFDCEYDLDNFNVVSVAKFNFGAMENKGLNVFRDSLVLADPDIATDTNYQRITDVIGHEYFHNWSGNRVTLANWFNLSLKEGLTVIREQMFTAFTTSEETERIEAVRVLRAGQFADDDGPLAHPVLLAQAESVENFYNGTTYQKGAEVIRMMKVMMGEQKFIEGVKHYFKTYDGQAVTIDEFVKSMEHVSGLDLSGQFHLWYTQSGRPRVSAQGVYDAQAKTYTLTLSQENRPTRDQPTKKPMLIPVLSALVDINGNNIGPERVLILDQAQKSFVFDNVDEEPAFHSVLRGFSAPVDIASGLSENQLYAQFLNDTDGFNRWDAGQKLALLEMKYLYQEYVDTGVMPSLSPRYVRATGQILADKTMDPALKALTLSRPSITEFESHLNPVDPAAVALVYKNVRETLARELSAQLYLQIAETEIVLDSGTTGYRFDYKSVGLRNMLSVAMNAIFVNPPKKTRELLRDCALKASDMTRRMIYLNALNGQKSQERDDALSHFFTRFKDDTLTIQKWFTLQAHIADDSAVDNVRNIMATKVFDWNIPGHVQSLIGGFAGNYAQFHRKDGKGYELLADCVIRLAQINPNMASRMVKPLCGWRKYAKDHADLMIAQLERVGRTPNLPVDVAEFIRKSLPESGTKKKTGPAPSP